MANNLKGLDAFQVLRSVFDVDMNCLRVCVVDGSTGGGGGGFEVIISHVNDSIRIGDGTNLVTSTTEGGKTGLDVNIVGDTELSRIDGTSTHDSVRIGDQNNEVSTTANTDLSKAGLDVNMLNRLIDVPHDDIEIIQFTTEGDPEVIQFREGGALRLTLTLTYNLEGDLQRVQRT